MCICVLYKKNDYSTSFFIYTTNPKVKTITTTMPILLDNTNNLVNIGPKTIDRPQLGIFINNNNNNKNNCSITTDANLKTSEPVTNFIEKWNVFQNTIGFQHLKNCQNVTLHYESITVKCIPAIDLEFGFHIDNSDNIYDQYAVISFYSNEKAEMVFENMAIKSGNIGKLLRHEDKDQAFCLTRNSASAPEHLSTQQKFNIAEKMNYASYTVMVTQAMEKKENKYSVLSNEELSASLEGEDEVDFDTADDETDYSPPEASHQQTSKRYFANTSRGRETNQTFSNVSLSYTGAPIDIYKFVILYES